MKWNYKWIGMFQYLFFSLSCINKTKADLNVDSDWFVLTCKNETRSIIIQVIVWTLATHALAHLGGILLSIDRSFYFEHIDRLNKDIDNSNEHTHTDADIDWSKSGMEWNEMQFFSVWSPWNLCRKCCCCFLLFYFSSTSFFVV